MTAPYIPAKDALFDNWIVNFDTLITASPTTYGLVAGQATALAALVATWSAAYLAATTPSTRTKPTVADKDAARAAAEAYARELANVVQSWPSITPMLLADLGLTVRDTTPTPIPTPATVPLLALITATNLAHTLRFADELTPASRAKPFGAIQLELWAGFADNPIADPASCAYYGGYTKNPVVVSLPAGQAGKVATYFARWVTRTGLVGNWSLPLSMTVASTTVPV